MRIQVLKVMMLKAKVYLRKIYNELDIFYHQEMLYFLIFHFIAVISACPAENENCICQKMKGNFVSCHEGTSLSNVEEFINQIQGPIQALRLIKPKIQNLPENVFHGHVISDFIIEGAGMTSDPKAFDALKTNLKRVILPSNKLTEIPNLSDSQLLEDLVVHENLISKLDENSFNNLGALKVLILSNNNIDNISDETFQSLTELIVLSLVGNKLTQVPKGPNSLQTILLRGNALSTINAGTFDTYPNLVHLDLANNSLNEIKKAMIPTSEKLIVLDFSNNKISSIESGAFENAKSLKSLVLAHNEIGNPKPDMFNGLENLASLNLSSNQISEITSGTFAKLKSLEELDLSGNNIINLPEDAFLGLVLLKALAIGGNPMKELQPDLLKDSPLLNSLSLANSGLTDIPEGARKFEKLQLLDLSGNKIEKLDKSMFENYGDLKILFLDDNKLTELPQDVFSSLKSLKVLDCSFNKLSKLTTHNFDSLAKSIIYINLEGNPLDCKSQETQQLMQGLISLKQKYNYMQLMMLPKIFIVDETQKERFPVKRVDILPCLPPMNPLMQSPSFNRGPSGSSRRVVNP